MVAGQRHSPPLSFAYKTRMKHGRWSETHAPSFLCLQDPHEAWSPVRDTRPLSLLPTRPARSMVAGQRHSPPLSAAYKTRTKHGRRSETLAPSLLCLQDPHEAWSSVRDTRPLSPLPTRPARSVVTTHHPLSPLPTRPARNMVAGQRHTPPLSSIYKTHTKHGRRSGTLTPSLLYLQDPHETWSSVRDTRSLSPLPTRPARSMVAGQRHTPPLSSANKTRTKHGRLSERHTPPLSSAYKTRTKHGRRSETHAPSLLCLQDPHKAWSPHTTSSLLCLKDPHMLQAQAYFMSTHFNTNYTILIL